MQERRDILPFQNLLRKEKPPNGEWESIADEYLDYVRYWDTVEGQKRDVIDFDLAPAPSEKEARQIKFIREGIENPPTKRERQRILNGLEGFDAKLETVRIPRDTSGAQQLEFLRAKVKANIAHSERKLNVPIDGLSYIERTMGVEPQLFSEEDIKAQHEVSKGIFQSMGYEYSEEGIRKYREERAVKDDQIAEKLKENSKNLVIELSNFIGVKLQPSYEISVVKEDKYWINWADGNRDGFKLRANTHRRHAGRWTKGKTEEMPSHEIAVHFGQMSAWLDEIKKGKLHPALGATNVTDPSQVAQEGLAQTLPYFVPNVRSQFSTEAEFELESGGLKSMVYNNVHFMVNAGEFDEAEIVGFVQKYLPAESEEEIKKQIKDRTENPVNQAYLYAYGIGYVNHRKYAQLLSLQGRREFLEFLFSQPTTPSQEQRFVNSLLRDSRNSSTPPRSN